MRTLSPYLLERIANISPSLPVGAKRVIRLIMSKKYGCYSAALTQEQYIPRAPAKIKNNTILFPAIKTTKGWQPERPINLEAAINRVSRRRNAGGNIESCGVGHKTRTHSLDQYDKNC